MRSIPEWQCVPHVVTYAMRGPATIRFSKVVDVDSGRLLAYRTMTEFFTRYGDHLQLMSFVNDPVTVVDDPRYLNQPFITSTHFKREPDGSKWSPTPCES